MNTDRGAYELHKVRICPAVNKEIEKSSEIGDLRGFSLRVTGFEPAAPWSQTKRSANWATPGYSVFLCFLPLWSNMWSNAHVRVKIGEEKTPKPQCLQGFPGFQNFPYPRGCYTLPNQVRCQLRHTPAEKGPRCCRPSSDFWFYLNRDDLSRKNWFAGQ